MNCFSRKVSIANSNIIREMKPEKEPASYIAEKESRRLPGKIYLPVLIAENLELQTGFAILVNMSESLSERDKNGFSPFALLLESLTARIMEKARFTFQNGEKAKGLAVLFFESVANSEINAETKKEIHGFQDLIGKLYVGAIREYQSRDIHMHNDGLVSADIKTYQFIGNSKIVKTKITRPQVDLIGINLMFELLAQALILVSDGRYCHVARIKDANSVINSYERLLKSKVTNRTELIKNLVSGTQNQERLLNLPVQKGE